MRSADAWPVQLLDRGPRMGWQSRKTVVLLCLILGELAQWNIYQFVQIEMYAR